jgi:hypothetical protein
MKRQHYLWFSRLSFGFSAAALISSLLGGCQSNDATLGPEQGHKTGVEPASITPANVAADTAESEEKTTKHALAKAEPKDPKAKDTPDEPGAKGDSDEAKSKAKADESEDPKQKQDPPSSEGLELDRLVVTQEIDEREPKEMSAIEIGDKPIIAFVKMKNESESPANILVTFEKAEGEGKVGFIELEVPPNKHGWRTWGQTRMIKQPGEWVAVVEGADGRELGRAPFTVSGTVSGD